MDPFSPGPPTIQITRHKHKLAILYVNILDYVEIQINNIYFIGRKSLFN